MQPDSGPLFGAPVAVPAPRFEPSKVIAAQRRRAKAERLRRPRAMIEPCVASDGSIAFAGYVHRPTYEDEWAAVCIERPEALATVERIAFEHAARTLGPLSIAKVWEDARPLIKGGLDQNHRAPAARMLMTKHRALAGRFRTRTNAGQVPERRRP